MSPRYSEPWVSDSHGHGWIIGTSGEVSEYKGCGSHEAEWLPGHQERAIACVNALAGFDDPAAVRAFLLDSGYGS